MARTERHGLQVDVELAAFIENEALPGTNLSADDFWQGFSGIVHDLGAEQRQLLTTRERLQEEIDDWNRDRKGDTTTPEQTEAFLRQIGYLQPEGPDFQVETANVDPEIATIAGPQLVVPVTNARYALNAANARWGSIYDALYGTDVLGTPTPGDYDPDHGQRVIRWVRKFLDDVVPLAGTSHADCKVYHVHEGRLCVDTCDGTYGLMDAGQFAGFQGDAENPTGIVLENNGLHIHLRIDRASPVGSADKAGIADVVLESAISTIIDCEDSVAAVDAKDKAEAYRNWLGLMKGTLEARFVKNGTDRTRRLANDIAYVKPDGTETRLKGRSLLLVRNVGLLMTNPAILDRDDREIQESLLDAVCTVLIARHDLNRTDIQRNSACGSIYVVEPKLHGPDEVAFVDRVFGAVEDILDLPRNTVKIGIMDEERRTSVNLKECIRAARSRVAFINTGFLDRTGDEIHTSMEAGTFLRKADIRLEPWIASYEDRNVDIGLACGFSGRAQIGKGMWTAADLMKDMVADKIVHPEAGANCAWVPSPTAVTLHATHYHHVDVFARQREIAGEGSRGSLSDLLTLPLAKGRNWTDEEIQAEVENNAQGILGYVVRWADQGIGCSKVPDIDDVAQMEDRATCRISSQLLANWIHHGVVTADRVMETMRRMAAKVDDQNEGDPLYRPMAPSCSGVAFQAACDLVFHGRSLPSGYTEPVLHARRLEIKAMKEANT